MLAKFPSDDLTIIYYSACVIPPAFQSKVWEQLEKAAQGMPIIAVTQHEMPVEHNLVVTLPRHHLSIYRQALLGAKEATTKYIALAEDDVLYSTEHFKYRPSEGKFAYNMNAWNITTWGEPLFTQKLGGRKNLGNLICEQKLFIEAMEERFKTHWKDDDIDLRLWAEPSKYERQLGVTIREAESFTTNPPNVMFSHETALSYAGLGERKRLGETRAYNIPYWGEAAKIRDYYK